MAFSRLPYNFEEALAEVKSWRASYKPDYNTEAVLVEEMQRIEGAPIEVRVLPLYTTPPQRTWVGLTDEEVGDLSDFAYANDEEFVRNVEKYLKEKNNG